MSMHIYFSNPLETKLDEVWRNQPINERYSLFAFEHVLEALPSNKDTRKYTGKSAHTTPEQLCTAFVALARSKFGALAPTVLEEWGIRSFQDLERIVILLIDNNLLCKNEKEQEFPFPDLSNLWRRFQLTAVDNRSNTKITYKPDLSNETLPDIPL